MAIYSQAYQSRLVDALASNFPVLHAYLGAEDFEKLAVNYIEQIPSHFRSIRWYGDQLSEFLAQQSRYKKHAHLSELALFEWAQTLVFDAADHPALQLDEVAKIKPEGWANMRFKIHPALQRINLQWNVVQIWQAITDQQPLVKPTKNADSVPWILWRQDLINRFCSLNESEAWAIDAVIKQFTFGAICEGLCQWMQEEEAGLHAASLLKSWIASGLLAGVEF